MGQQPGLPLKKGRAGTMTHDYKRNGTTTLFAALDVANGTVIGECLARHRADEFLLFLKKVDRETPAHLDLHLILDNYATHKTPAVKRWLARHKRFALLFTPTSGSWLNLVERLFAEITRQRIRRGDLQQRCGTRVMLALDGLFAPVDALIGPLMTGPMMVASNFTGHPCLHLRTGFLDLGTRSSASLGASKLATSEADTTGRTFRVPQGISLWGRLFEEGPLLNLGMAMERALGVAELRPAFPT